jgi:hypothetical protein
MATSKGQAKAHEEVSDLPAPSSEAGGSDQGLLDIQSYLIMALQQAQVKQAIDSKNDREATQKQFSTLNTSL